MTTDVTVMSEAAERVKRKRAARLEEAEAPAEKPRPSAMMLDSKDERLGYHELPLSAIIPADHNARVETDEEKQKELTASVKEHGVLQPVLVRPMEDGTYELIAGWRRWTAAKAAKLTDIPAVVTVAEDQTAHVKGMVENLQREDLDEIDEARAFQHLLGLPGPDGKKLTQAALAKAVGKSQPYVSNALRLLQLPDEVITHVQTGQMTVGAAKAIVSLPREAQQRVAKEAVRRKMTTSQVESEARYERERAERAAATKAKEAAVAELYQSTIEAARKAKTIRKNTTILVYGERYVEALKAKGIEASVFDNQQHTIKNGKIDCKDDAVLIEVQDWKQPMEARTSQVCTVRQHYNDAIAEERRKAQEEAELQVGTVNEARQATLKVLRDEAGSLTELGQRFALYTILFEPFQPYAQGRQHIDEFFRRNAPDLIGKREYTFPRMWGVWPTILSMPLEKVTYEIVAHGLGPVIPNVFADSGQRTNADHAQLRQSLVDTIGLEPTIVWGGFEPQEFKTREEAIAAALTPHEFTVDEVWMAEAYSAWVAERDGPDAESDEESEKAFHAEYDDQALCAVCAEGGEEVLRSEHDEAMKALTEPEDDPEATPEPDPDAGEQDPTREADEVAEEESEPTPA